MAEIVVFGVSVVLLIVLVGRWYLETRAHNRRLSALGLRVHVNGIRGKSTVTRIVAGVLREAGVVTVAKTTGSAAAVIDAGSTDRSISRRGAATILEQLDVVNEYLSDEVQAFVVECMALRPSYQAISEAMIVRSNIGIITNVREDHQEIMGETLPEIARSLLNTCPRNGVLITAEQDAAILSLMEEEAQRRGSTLMIADPDAVTDEDIARFSYVAFKENVAIALSVAYLLGIPRDRAMDGMVKAPPDPGVLRIMELSIGEKAVTWANLLAVNDRESAVLAVELVMRHRRPDSTTVCLLNNRSDRERRAMQFADVTTKDLQFDRIVTLGAYERVVTERLIENGFPRDRIIDLGEEHRPTLEDILERAVTSMPTAHVLLIGMVNIHTEHAELLLNFLEGDQARETSALAEAPDESYPA